MLRQLPSARGNSTVHYDNLNRYSREGRPAADTEREFWQIDQDIFNEFLNMLPPIYVPHGFAMREMLTGSITSHFFEIDGDYWCATLNLSDKAEPQKMVNHIRKHKAAIAA